MTNLTAEEIEQVALDGATLAYRYLPRRSNDTVLDEIRLQAAMIAKATEMLAADVKAARRLGHSWSEIGAALGVSKQAAQQRFGE